MEKSCINREKSESKSFLIGFDRQYFPFKCMKGGALFTVHHELFWESGILKNNVDRKDGKIDKAPLEEAICWQHYSEKRLSLHLIRILMERNQQ
jgi:hypothetical protein